MEQKTAKHSVEELVEFFEYLDELRESGATNMSGATPFIERKFSLPYKEAGAVLMLWMDTFNHDQTLEERAEAAITRATK